MSRKKVFCCLYFFTQENKGEWLPIGEFDILDLPYDLITDDTPLLITEDVDLRKYRPQGGDKIPSLKNVFVRGNFYCSKHVKVFPDMIAGGIFDCSHCGKDYIDQDTKLPRAMREMDCSFSITGLDVLIGKLPKQLQKIYVEKNLIDKKSLLKDPKKLDAARRFVLQYQDVSVLDTAGRVNLWDVLYDIDMEIDNDNNKANQEVAVNIPQPKNVNKYQQKTDKDIDINTLVSMVRNNIDFYKYNLTDDEIKRYIKTVLSELRLNGITKYYRMRGDDIVTCINISVLDTVYQDLIHVIEDSQRVKEIKKDLSVKKVQDVQPKIQTNSKPKPINIKKYISYSDYKKICAFSNEAAAISVLENINEINLDPSADINYQGAVQILKNDKIILLSSVKKEQGCSIVQPIDGNFNSDRKRVVWTVGYGPDGLVIVCVGVLDKHSETTKEKKLYRELLNRAKNRYDFSKQDLEKYIDISTILDADKKFVKPFGNPGDAYGI